MSGKKTDTITKDKAVRSEETTTKTVKKTAKSEKTAEKRTAAKNSAEKKSTASTNSTKKSSASEKKPEAKKANASKSKTAEKPADEKAVKPTVKTAAKKAPVKEARAKTTEKSVEATEKKPAKPRKKAETKQEELKTGEPSSKTPQVMKLVQQRNDMVNPTIMAGKSSIPRQLRGLEPLSRIMKREAEEVFGADEAETYNLTALVIDEHAAEILRRFNACDCELCVETLARLTAEVVPARFAKLRKRDVEREAPEVKQLKEPLQKTVTSRMVRLVMQNKKRSYHD